MPIHIENTRPVWPAMVRGWKLQCPACGQGRMFGRFLKVNERCPQCATELHHQRADDAPPYFTMFIVAHIVIAGLLLVERKWQPDTWVHLVLWLPATTALSLWLLPRIKGALIGQQWALRMHGFGVLMPGIDSPETFSGDDVAAQTKRARPS
jgi:uncharacterized protein (DUF983 family)